MIKDGVYFCGLDLVAVSARIPSDRESRLRSEELGDIVVALLHRCATEIITPQMISSLLGEPDRTRRLDGGELVWEYDWIGKHGPNEYSSHTPIVFRSGRMVGIEDEGEIRAL